MSNMELEERLILDKALAYFMGWRIDNSFPDKDRIWRNGNSVEVETTFKFSSDWNWLMEVYREIHNLDGYRIKIANGYCAIFNYAEKECEISCKDTKEAVYKCFGVWANRYNKSQISK